MDKGLSDLIQVGCESPMARPCRIGGYRSCRWTSQMFLAPGRIATACSQRDSDSIPKSNRGCPCSLGFLVVLSVRGRENVTKLRRSCFINVFPRPRRTHPPLSREA